MAKKRKTVGTKAIDAEKEILEKMITQGLRLQLQSARRKNPYFKRGSEYSVKMSRKEKRAAMSFARCVVRAYYLAARENTLLVSPN
jgi:hypothetical protein